jgi:transcriptional regulator with XRE-family HTH domain
MKTKKGRLTIGSEIKTLMEKEGFSGYRISKETGIDETYVSKIIHNRINPSYLTLRRILDVLGYGISFEKQSQGKEAKGTRLKGRKQKS